MPGDGVPLGVQQKNDSAMVISLWIVCAMLAGFAKMWRCDPAKRTQESEWQSKVLLYEAYVDREVAFQSVLMCLPSLHVDLAGVVFFYG